MRNLGTASYLKSYIMESRNKLVLHPKHEAWLRKGAIMLNKAKIDRGGEYGILRNATVVLNYFRKGPPHITALRPVKSARYYTQMFKLVNKSFKEATKWFEHKDDVEAINMVGHVLLDGADYFCAALYLLKGQDKKAAEFVDYLDTASRDEVPETVYNYLERFL
jgi:hypothetical protein